MTTDELVSALSPVRIPETFTRFGYQDALAAVALGLLAGLLVATVLKALTVPKSHPVDVARAAIAALAVRGRQERITGLAALLRANGGAAPDGLRAALYDPEAAVDPAPLEAAVLAAARRASRR